MNFAWIAALLGAVLASAVLAIWGPDMTSYEVRRGPTDAQWNPRFPATRPGVWSLTLRGGSAGAGTMADDAGGADGNCGGGIKQMVDKACSLWDDECDDEAAEELLQKALAIAPEDPDVLCAYGVLLQVTRRRTTIPKIQIKMHAACPFVRVCVHSCVCRAALDEDGVSLISAMHLGNDVGGEGGL